MASADGPGPAIGFLLNPVAGVGGPAGLVGSDGTDVQREAGRRGSVPRAAERAVAALAAIARAHPGAKIVTAAGALGEDSVRAAGLRARVVYAPRPLSRPTTGEDTMRATVALGGAGASLILFTGGDGTARDVAAGLAPGVAVIGIPAGVKMYSACFAISSVAAGALASAWLARGPLPTHDAEVLDLDEDQLRAGRPDPRLFALVPLPTAPGRTQARKAATPASETAAVHRAAVGLAAALRPGVRYLLGPGSTLSEVARVIGVTATPLGVDIVEDGKILVRDASEAQVLSAVAGREAKAVVTVIGGQGFLLGRGNQQLSSRVIDALGPSPLLVVATEQKLIDLGGKPLLVDSGDAAVDARLAGPIRVITAPDATSIYPVEAAAGGPQPTLPDLIDPVTTEGESPCV
jgi:predicted polyphosphate/ATP-dependent NAD kinase